MKGDFIVMIYEFWGRKESVLSGSVYSADLFSVFIILVKLHDELIFV